MKTRGRLLRHLPRDGSHWSTALPDGTCLYPLDPCPVASSPVPRQPLPHAHGNTHAFRRPHSGAAVLVATRKPGLSTLMTALETPYPQHLNHTLP